MNWRCFRSSWVPRRRWWTAPRRAVLPLKTARGLLHIRDRKRRRDNTADDYRRAAAAALAPASSSQARQLSRPPLLRSKHITNIDSLSLTERNFCDTLPAFLSSSLHPTPFSRWHYILLAVHSYYTWPLARPVGNNCMKIKSCQRRLCRPVTQGLM